MLLFENFNCEFLKMFDEIIYESFDVHQKSPLNVITIICNHFKINKIYKDQKKI